MPPLEHEEKVERRFMKMREWLGEWEATAIDQVRNSKVYFRRSGKKGWLEEMADQ